MREKSANSIANGIVNLNNLNNINIESKTNNAIKVAIETYGCTMNQSDSDIMRCIISLNPKFTLSDVDEADVVVINSCGVIDYTERKILKRAENLKKRGKKVVIAGCLPKISNKKVRAIADAALSPDNLHLINKAIEQAFVASNSNSNSDFNVNKFIKIDRNFLEKSSMCKLRLRTDKSGMEAGIAIVSISEGCTGKCTFCATRFARGRLRSFRIESIVEEIRKAVNEGYVEIQLTSQDTGAYGIDRYGKQALCELLEKIDEIETNREFMVRVGMMNPKHAYDMLDELLNAYKSKRIYKFLHIPLQSGDERILKAMKRGHGVEEYKEVVSAFRKSFDDCVISTDIIVGFPGEDELSFYKTFEVIRETKPDLVNITRFSPRKGTPASKLKDLPGWIKKERSRILTKLVNVIKEKRNRKFVGRVVDGVVTKKGKSKFLVRMQSYRAVILNSEIDCCKINFRGKNVKMGVEIGDFLKVKIVKATPTHLEGELEELEGVS